MVINKQEYLIKIMYFIHYECGVVVSKHNGIMPFSDTGMTKFLKPYKMKNG